MWNPGPCDRDDFHNLVTLTFDLWVNACRATAIEYMCTKFGVDSSSCFPVKARKNRQTNRQTQLNALTTLAAMPAWVTGLDLVNDRQQLMPLVRIQETTG